METKEKYAVVKSFLDYEPGDVVEMDASVAGPFVQAGLLEVAPDEEVDRVEAPEFVANAAKELSLKIDTAVVEATKKAVERVAHHTAPSGVKLPAEAKGSKWGFKNVGEFCQCVIAKERGDLGAARKIETYRTKAPTLIAGGPSVTATDGGVLVPPDYASDLFLKVDGINDITDNCQSYTVSGNTLEIPVDNSTGYNTGVQAYWVDENTAFTETKPILNLIEVKLKKLGVLCSMSEELIQDNAYNFTTYLQSRVPLTVISNKNENLLRGAGGGANIINHAATVVVTRATAGHISFADVTAMYSRCHANNIGRAAWYVSPSILPELQNIVFPGGYPVMLPSSGMGNYPSITGTPVGTIYGRPVILSENLGVLGQKGDILLADFGAVAKIEKPMDVAESIHVYFNKAVNALRFMYRFNTASQWLTPWTRLDGVTASPFVVLTGPASMAMVEDLPKKAK